MQSKQHILSCLVSNHSGVLTRISGLFARRGYNITSLSVCETEDKDLSRMTIVVSGDDYILDQITKQLDKLYDVKYIQNLKPEAGVQRELLLIKLKISPDKLPVLNDVVGVYKAKTIDLSPTSMILELTGDSNKIDAFINVLRSFEILELARTGITTLERGESCIKQLAEYEDKI